MRKLAITCCLAVAFLVSASPAGAMDFKVRTKQGGKCDVSSTAHPTILGLYVGNCSMKVTEIFGLGQLYSSGSLIYKHKFGPSGLPYAVMMRYLPPDDSAPQSGDYSEIKFQLELKRGGKDPQTWARPKDRRCYVMESARPGDTLRCTIREATS